MSTTSLISPTLAPEGPATAGLVRSRVASHPRILRFDRPIRQAFIISGLLLAIALTGRHLDLSRESLDSSSSMFLRTALCSPAFCRTSLVDDGVPEVSGVTPGPE